MTENAENTTNVVTPQLQAPVRFDRAFTSDIAIYIQECQQDNTKPTVKGFATRIGTDVFSLWQWANKKKKNDVGELTDELARPNFHAELTKLDALEKEQRKEQQEKDIRLKPQQELFCQLYATSKEHFGNAVQCYAIAYSVDIEDKKLYNSARVLASNLLTNINILKRVDELLSDITDEVVDQELAFVIRQRYELPSKIAAIREWNKVRGRITEKLDHTSKGEKISQVVGFQYVRPEDIDAPDNTDNQTN